VAIFVVLGLVLYGGDTGLLRMRLRNCQREPVETFLSSTLNGAHFLGLGEFLCQFLPLLKPRIDLLTIRFTMIAH